MQVPQRKAGKYTFVKPDPKMTEAKYFELQKKLERLKKNKKPAIEEVKRLALMGDFSENAAYQIAKGRLRGINQRILDITEHLKKAEIIKPPKKTDRVGLGNTVTIEMNGKRKIYLILGSSEADPNKGIISYTSPIGSVLMGKKVGDTFKLELQNKTSTGKIIAIE